MIHIGIDPGLSGAIGATDEHGRCDVYDTPTTKVVVSSRKKSTVYDEVAMRRLLTQLVGSTDSQCMVWIERQHSMPAFGGDVCPACRKPTRMLQGIASSFKTGEGYGLWRGIIVGLGLSYTPVAAPTWKRKMLMDQGKGKSASVLRALQLFPGCSVVGPKGGAKDGRAEALLIATYGMWVSGSVIEANRQVPVIDVLFANDSGGRIDAR